MRLKNLFPIVNFTALRASYGVDQVYGPHFTVTVEDKFGRKSVDRYLGPNGKRVVSRKQV